MIDKDELDIVAEFANMTSQYTCVITIAYNEGDSKYKVKIDGDSLYTTKYGDNLEETIIEAIVTIDRQSLVQQQNNANVREGGSSSTRQ